MNSGYRALLSISVLVFSLGVGVYGIPSLFPQQVNASETEAAQGRPQPIADGHQMTLKIPGTNREVEVFCYKGELILLAETSSAAGSGVAVHGIKDSEACQ